MPSRGAGPAPGPAFIEPWKFFSSPRHEHALIFAQAFDLFFRAAEDWKHMLDSVPLPDHARKKPPPASRRVQEALAQPSMRDEAEQAQEQELRLSGSAKRLLPQRDFAQMSAP